MVRAAVAAAVLLPVAAVHAFDVPADFDCGMRKLAYDFGRQLQPRQGKFESLYYALNLNSKDCHVELSKVADGGSSSSLTSTSSSSPASSSSSSSSGPTYFVDASVGVDASDRGTSEKLPLRTIQAAVDRAVGQANATVLLRAGTHFLQKAVQLGPEHSGLTIKSYPNEEAVISGGKKVDVQWTPHELKPAGGFKVLNDLTIMNGFPNNVTIRDYGKKTSLDACSDACQSDGQCTSFTWHDETQFLLKYACWGRLDGDFPAGKHVGRFTGLKTLGSNIWKANIKGQVDEVWGLQLDGKRATRARFPNLPGGIEVTPGYGYMIPGGSAKWAPPNTSRFEPVTYFTDNTPEHRRNTTVDNWFQQYMIGVNGLCGIYDPPVSYWCSEHPSGGGAFAFRTPSGMEAPSGLLPNAPYQDVSEMILNVWRPARWANWMFEVERYNSSSNNFTFGRGGNQGARGENTGGDFFVENVMEELDHPGEFFFDKSTGDLYLFYNGTGAPPASMEVIVPQIPVLLNLTGSQWNPVRGVTISDIGFKSTRYTYMEPHGVPSGGDWALDRIAAVFLEGTEGVTVQGSTFERLDGNGVILSGYNRNATVQENDFAYIGGNAIISWGYTNETADSGFPMYTPRTNFPNAGVDGTDGNHPLDNKILKNLGREVGLYEKQSSFYIQSKTARSTISENVFFNGPRAGINFNDGFGGGDVLASNLVFSTCRESGDHGPFNSWDRQPYLTTVRNGTPSMVMAWREIHHNFFIDNYSPQESIDNDDGSGFFKSHHNVLIYGANGLKNDFGGHDNWHFENFYGFIDQALGVDQTLPDHEDRFFNNTAALTGGNLGEPVCTGDAITLLADNQYYTPTGNISVCGKNLPDAQKAGLDLGSRVGTIPNSSLLLGEIQSLLQIKPSDAAGARPDIIVV